MEGFFNLNKPAGPTSHDMVNMVRQLLHQQRVGHGGTLDPLAQGVLPIGVGRATRLLLFLQGGKKTYRATLHLGVSTTTFDAAGEVTAESKVPPLDQANLEQALAQFVGEIEQTPPLFSAIRYRGRRLYERARVGEKIVPPSRRVHIYRTTILDWASPLLRVEIACGSGTYIRSLAHDLGEYLGCGAHLSDLVRLQVGPFSLAESCTPEQLELSVKQRGVKALLLPMDVPVRHWPALQASERQSAQILNGQSLDLSADEVPIEPGRARAYDPAGRFIALLQYEQGHQVWHPFRVFHPLEHVERPE
jgi:tRNA pseudouridine55 synthase